MDKKVLMGGAIVLAIAGYLLYSKKKCGSSCDTTCATACDDQNSDKHDPFLVTNEDYSSVVASYDEALRNIAEACDISTDEATSKLSVNQDAINNLKSDIETFIVNKVKVIETEDEAKLVKLNIFDQFVAKIKNDYAINNERQQFFDSIFSDMRVSIASNDPVEA